MDFFIRRHQRGWSWSLFLSAALVWVLGLSTLVSSQSYPSKPIRLVVPFSPGGGTDIIARLLGQELTVLMGQAVVIDNRGGSGGTVGNNLVAKADPDGYTLGLCSLSFSYAPALYAKLPYDTEKDFTPVSMVATQPFVFTAHPSLGISTMLELVNLAKAKPGFIHYGSGGAGASSHLGTELLRSMTGIDLVHVPYKGTGPALSAAISGEIQLQLIGISSVVAHMKSGRLKFLAVSGAKRSPAAPDIPTVAESGVNGYVFDVWYGTVLPAHTPGAIVHILNTHINHALKVPSLVQRFATAGLDAAGNDEKQFKRQIHEEIVKWRKVASTAHISVN
jgi:tripartite-type tricarboxylate transporter receptor subunit TctC